MNILPDSISKGQRCGVFVSVCPEQVATDTLVVLLPLFPKLQL